MNKLWVFLGFPCTFSIILYIIYDYLLLMGKIILPDVVEIFVVGGIMGVLLWLLIGTVLRTIFNG